MKFNFKVIIKFLGLLLVLNGVFMLICLPVGWWHGDKDPLAILYAALITIISGSVFWFINKDHNPSIKKRDGFLIVTAGWLIMSFFGTLPYMFTGAVNSFADAFFETMSGFTTTGSSIFTDIESLPKGLLLWRSITQWIGGMGIIVLTIAILPILGIGGMELFVMESPGPTPSKLNPRIKETAKRLWGIYVALTFAETVLLTIGGMTVFDAVNHSLTTISTGGFSTKDISLAHYTSPFIHYVVIIFMFLSGVNFTLIYLGFKGRFKELFKNEEFRYYSLGTIIVCLLVSLIVIFASGRGLEKSFRDASFQVISIITTTGFVTADYTKWTPFLYFLFFALFFVGGSTGSTSGGIKTMRHVVMFKNSFLELKRLLHPAAIIPVKLNRNALSGEITMNILAFFLLYLISFIFGALIMSAIGLDFETSIGSVVATLGNIGPGLGKVGPVDNFGFIPDVGKWFLSFLMLLGRLELFTVLVLFSPYFWKSS